MLKTWPQLRIAQTLADTGFNGVSAAGLRILSGAS